MNRGTIIFDFDGTLADSFDVVSEIFYELTGHERITDLKEIARLRKLPLKTVGKELGITMRQIPKLIVRGRALMNRRLNQVKIFTGIPEVLKELYKEGWQMMVISSNSHQNVEAYLESQGLLKFFEKVYGGVAIFGKSLALRKVIRQNKLNVEGCFYIGDEVRDLQAAAKAHIRAVAVTWGFNDKSLLKSERPYAIVDTPAELAKLFEN